MTEDPKAKRAARPGRGLKIALFVSLAVNLAVAGLVIGAFAAHDRHGAGPGGPRDGAAPYLRALDGRDRAAVRQELRQRLGTEGRSPGARRPDYSAAGMLLRADPFDPVAFERMLQDQFSGGVTAQEVGRQVLVARIAGMSGAERAAYADRLEAAARDRLGRRSHD